MGYTRRYKYSHGARTSVTLSEVGVQEFKGSKPSVQPTRERRFIRTWL